MTIVEDRRDEDPGSFRISINYGLPEGRVDGPDETVEADRRQDVRKRAMDTARERIEAARTEGAWLHMRSFRPEDLHVFVEHAPGGRGLGRGHE
jgi:hypothetical protein